MIKAEKGFTLIEVMMVVAIIGILTSIALPQYQNYVKRAHVSEGLGLASVTKFAVIDHFVSQGKWPRAAELDTDEIRGNAVKGIGISGGGNKKTIITITYGPQVMDGGQITLSPTDRDGGSFTWKCAGTAEMQRYLPANCRDSS